MQSCPLLDLHTHRPFLLNPKKPNSGGIFNGNFTVITNRHKYTNFANYIFLSSSNPHQLIQAHFPINFLPCLLEISLIKIMREVVVKKQQKKFSFKADKEIVPKNPRWLRLNENRSLEFNTHRAYQNKEKQRKAQRKLHNNFN